jgi:hypothetical protein
MNRFAAPVLATMIAAAACDLHAQSSSATEHLLRLDKCHELTVVYQNINPEAERSLLPSGFVARRNNLGRPPVWLENLWCDSIVIDGAASPTGGYTMLLAAIVPPDGSDTAAAQHFYVLNAFTNIAGLHEAMKAVGMNAELVAEMRLSASAPDDVTVTLGGSSPFTATFRDGDPTTVHTHNWFYWRVGDGGRARIHVEFTGDAGRRGPAATFSGEKGTALNDLLGNQPIGVAMSEPSSARLTLTLVTP